MPTKHSRIGVTRDPELDRALALTQAQLVSAGIESSAAQVRALALRGAQEMLDGLPADQRLPERIRRRVVRPATRDIRDLPLPTGEIDPDDPTPASDALAWVRGRDRDH